MYSKVTAGRASNLELIAQVTSVTSLRVGESVEVVVSWASGISVSLISVSRAAFFRRRLARGLRIKAHMMTTASMT